MTGLAQVLAIERALGVTAGHDATVAFVERAIGQIDSAPRPTAGLARPAPRSAAVDVHTDDPVDYDPYDAAIHADPFPTFRRLRDEAPIYYCERRNVWALSRHADVEKALGELGDVLQLASDILEIIQSGMDLPPAVVMFEDPPKHTMHRGLMSRVFTPRRMNALEQQVRAFCAACLDPLVGQRPVRLRHRPRRRAADARDRHAPRASRSPSSRRCGTDPTPSSAPRRASRWRCGKRPSPTATCTPSTSTGGSTTRPTI